MTVYNEGSTTEPSEIERQLRAQMVENSIKQQIATEKVHVTENLVNSTRDVSQYGAVAGILLVSAGLSASSLLTSLSMFSRVIGVVLLVFIFALFTKGLFVVLNSRKKLKVYEEELEVAQEDLDKVLSDIQSGH